MPADRRTPRVRRPRPEPIYVVKAEFFRVLGHPARVRILELPARRGDERRRAAGGAPARLQRHVAAPRGAAPPGDPGEPQGGDQRLLPGPRPADLPAAGGGAADPDVVARGDPGAAQRAGRARRRRTRRPAGSAGPARRGASAAAGRTPRRPRPRGTPGASAGFTAATIAPCRPSATSWVKVMLDVVEAGLRRGPLVLADRQRAGDAADPAAALGALGGA